MELTRHFILNSIEKILLKELKKELRDSNIILKARNTLVEKQEITFYNKYSKKVFFEVAIEKNKHNYSITFIKNSKKELCLLLNDYLQVKKIIKQ